MPGLSMLFDFHGNALKREADFIRSMDSVLPGKQYRREDLFHDNALLLGCTRYENYPAAAFHGELFSIFLEGRVYGKNLKTLESELTLLAETLFRDRSRGKEKLLKWLLAADGEFVAFIRRRDTGEIILFNDLLGHLPLYCYSNGDFFLISREIGIFQTFLSGIQLDRMAVAQYLLFAFSLGSRTLMENVRRVKRASLFHWVPGDREVNVETLHELNYDFEEHAG